MHYAKVLMVVSTALGAVALPRAVDSSPAKYNFSTYNPVPIKCPARQQWVRPAQGLSDKEALWVQSRKKKVLTGLGSYLVHLHFDDFNVDEYLQRLGADCDNVPTIGMVISGGGWASALTSTGPLRAFDGRLRHSVKERTGGLLQTMTYLSGLSGGSWPVLSIATYADNPNIDEMVSRWHVEQSPLDAPRNTAHRATVETILRQVYDKFAAGYKVSYGDFLGRSTAYEFIGGANGGMATTISGISQMKPFKEHDIPFPMWQAAQGSPLDVEYYTIEFPYYNATLYEWNPFEFGAWDGPSAFFPTEYLGTKMVHGHPADECVVGFDRAAFMWGVAGDAWSAWWISALSDGNITTFQKREAEAELQQALERRSDVQPEFPVGELIDVAKVFKKLFNYTRNEGMYTTMPNPFATNASVSNSANPPLNLTLVDGSEAGQALPLWSQIQPARKSDFIVVWDNDQEAGPYVWSNGENLHETYIYATNASVPFPIIPRASTFINRNYTNTPTFFGCDANLTNTNSLAAPIVLYLANAPYSSYTNFSGYQANFTHEEMAVILTNGFNIATQANGTLDAEWPECLGCAAIDRSLARVGMNRTVQCQACMDRYCWDGTEFEGEAGIVNPSLKLDPSLSFTQWNASGPQDGRFWVEVEK